MNLMCRHCLRLNAKSRRYSFPIADASEWMELITRVRFSAKAVLRERVLLSVFGLKQLPIRFSSAAVTDPRSATTPDLDNFVWSAKDPGLLRRCFRISMQQRRHS